MVGNIYTVIDLKNIQIYISPLFWPLWIII